MKKDCLMTHTISTNTLNNARNFSHNSVQGHHHSILAVERYADKNSLRWSMSTGCLMDGNSLAARYAAGSVLKKVINGIGMCIGDVNTLYISDLHLPYHHRDAFDFLFALNEYYKFDQVFNVGDLYDHHTGNYHETEPDALSPEKEYEEAKKYAHELQDIFPDMIISTGNHDNIPKRKMKTVGLPYSMVGDYNKLYDTEDGWEFVDSHWHSTYGAYPITVPMVLNKRSRWDKVIPKL